MVVRLRGIDAAFLALESPTGHLQGVGIVRFEPSAAPLGLEELIALVGRREPGLDVLHRRLVTVPAGLDRPYWMDVEPDLRRHIRARRLPDGGDPRDFERFCAELAARPFDRSAPMWEFWLVDGLPDGAQALVIKLHHSLCDGLGSLAMVARLFDTDPEAPERDDVSEPWPEEAPPAVPWLLGQAALHALRRPFELAAATVEMVGSALRVRGTVEAMAGAALAAPLATPHLPFHGPITADRVVALRDLPLGRVKDLAHASGTHVNDVIVAVLAGTLRRWLLAHDELPDQPLVAAVPVSTRGPEEIFSPGNYVSACFVHLPTHIEDPGERLRITAEVASGGKAVHRAIGSETLERLTSLAYPLVLSVPMDLYRRAGGAAHHPAPVNLVVSNVAGPSFDLYLQGRPVEAFYALGPIFDGVALNITAISFGDVLGIGYLTCPDLLGDLAELADGQDDAFEELAAAYGV